MKSFFNFFARLTGAGKVLAIALFVAVIGAALYFTGATQFMADKVSTGNPVVVAVNTYSGFSPLISANGGLETAEGSEFAKRGLNIKFVVIDDFAACRSALVDGVDGTSGAQIGYCTLDALCTEMQQESAMKDFRYIMLLNFSNGADAMVAKGSITNSAELKGKKVAYAQYTASQTLLMNYLETSGLTMHDIEPVLVSNGTEAATFFKSQKVDVCVTWSPDDEDCVNSVKNSHILTSTAQASSLVSDGFIASKQWLDKNKELASKIVEAFLWANADFNSSDAAKQKAADAFAANFEVDNEFAQLTVNKVKPCTLQDNLRWFGFDTNYSGMTASRIYTKMAQAYTENGDLKNVIPFNKVAYTDLIEMIAENNTLDNDQTPFGTADKAFTAPTEQHETKTAISQKKVTINFPIAGYTLDNTAREIIDKEFLDIVREFSSMRVRVVGNTDNTGSYNINMDLSKKRANSVVDYLCNEYNIDKNRFIVVGNGPKKAIEDKVEGADANYRTTDLELVAE